MRDRLSKTLAVHGDAFHFDDALSAAMLERIYDLIVVRTFDREVYEKADIRADIGGKDCPATGDFDHHAPAQLRYRPNGIPYASAGLVWKHYGVRICGGNPDIARIVGNRLVQQVDAEDNGVSLYTNIVESVFPMTASQVVRDLNPKWNEPQNFDNAFKKAVEIAGMILDRTIACARSLVDGQGEVIKALLIAERIDPRIIVLEKEYDWGGKIKNRSSAALYIIYPDPSGRWRVKCVNKDRFEPRKPLPIEWAGKNDEELARITGVPGAFFCHAKRFTAGAKTREGAIKLARLAADA